MKVAAIQHDVVWENAEATCARLVPQVAAAAATGARLVVLTEMFSTGFSMNTGAIAEPGDGPSTRWLQANAREHGVWLAASIPIDDGSGRKPANTLTLAGPTGEVAARYEKIHPFTYSGEHEHYRAGESFVTVEVEGVRATFFVCYDLRFADEFWATADGTDLYVVPANWPDTRRRHWQQLLVARAIENQAYVLGCNRVGQGGKLTYVGDSRIIDPMGEILAAGAHTETILTAEVDPAVVTKVRERFPFMQDRR